MKAKFNERIRGIQTLPALDDPLYTKALAGLCDGLMEIRFRYKNVQYRPLAWYGPERREVTIFVGAEERNSVFVPADACRIALDRKAKALDPTTNRKHVVSHDFS